MGGFPFVKSCHLFVSLFYVVCRIFCVGVYFMSYMVVYVLKRASPQWRDVHLSVYLVSIDNFAAP